MSGPSSDRHTIDSTEIYKEGMTSWTTVGPLPSARSSVGYASFNNMIFVTGGGKNFQKKFHRIN